MRNWGPVKSQPLKSFCIKWLEPFIFIEIMLEFVPEVSRMASRTSVPDTAGCLVGAKPLLIPILTKINAISHLWIYQIKLVLLSRLAVKLCAPNPITSSRISLKFNCICTIRSSRVLFCAGDNQQNIGDNHMAYNEYCHISKFSLINTTVCGDIHVYKTQFFSISPQQNNSYYKA